MLRQFLLVLVATLLITTLVCGCSSQVNQETKNMMQKYGLHPVMKPSKKSFVLNEFIFKLINSASNEIGLDLKEFKGKKVKVLSYPLKEKSQGRTGEISANFIFKGRKIVGAYLNLNDYTPGVASLKDRSNFVPKNLNVDNLGFTGVNKIKLIGPWDNDMWKNKYVLHERSEINSFISLYQQSVKKKGNKSPDTEDEEYMIIFYFSDGPIIRSNLVTEAASFETWLTVNSYIFYKWHYSPKGELKEFVVNKLS